LRPKICFSKLRFWHILKYIYIYLPCCRFPFFDNNVWAR
jgi:hypothetical protein